MSRFLKWVVNLILIVSILVACALLVPPLTGVTTVIVDDVNMVTNLARGSVTYAVEKEFGELVVGDNVLIQGEDSDYVYRLNSVEPASGSGELEDVKSTDGQTKTEVFDSKVLKAVLTIPFIGYVVMAMKSTEGLIIIGLGVIFVIILFILSELWKKDKYEEEDEEDDKVQVASVDMSAHILEKVSSEIGTEVSSIAQDTNPIENEVAVDAGMTQEVPVTKDKTETQEVPVVEATKSEEAKNINADIMVRQLSAAMRAHSSESKVAKVVVEESKETTAKESVEPVAEELAEVTAGDDIEVTTGEVEELVQTDEMESTEEELVSVEIAMPNHPEAELIQKAKAAGHNPEVKRDDATGITILDYSDIL